MIAVVQQSGDKMALPTSRTEFKDYCLRKLGFPVIEINVEDMQVEDRIDESFSYYWDYHFDGVERGNEEGF